MFWPLAFILVAVAAFSALVVRRRRPPEPGSGIDRDQLDGFVYVGAGALALLAVGVVVLGLLDDANGVPESVAVLGFLAFGVYLATATVITYASARRR